MSQRANGFVVDDEGLEALDVEEGRKVLRRHYRPSDFDGFSITPARDHMAMLMRDVPRALLPKPAALDAGPAIRQGSPEVASEVRREPERRSLARKVADAVTGRTPGEVTAFGHYGPAGLQYDRETGTVSEADFGPWVPDVVTSRPPNAFDDPRYRQRRISAGGHEDVRKENLDSGRLAEMVAQRVEAPDLFLTRAERERLANPEAPRSGRQIFDTLTGLANGRLFVNSAVNTAANLTAAGIRSLGGFGDAQQAALEGRHWVDAGTGKRAPGLAEFGLDGLDWLAMPGSGPLAGLMIRRAERAAGKPADGPALAANQPPEQPRSRPFGVTKPKAEPMGPEEILDFISNYGAENGLPVSRQTVKPPPPGQRRYNSDEPSVYMKVEDPARKAKLSEKARLGVLNRGGDPDAIRERVVVRVSDHPDEPGRAAPNRIDVLRARNQRGEPLTDPDNLRDALDSVITPADNSLRLTPPGSKPERTFKPRKFDPFDTDVDTYTAFHHSALLKELGGRRGRGFDEVVRRENGNFHSIVLPDGRRAWVRVPELTSAPRSLPEAPRFLRHGEPVFDAVNRPPRDVWRDVMDWYSGQGRLLANQAGQQERSAMRGLGQDHTPFYGDDVGPRGRIPDPGSEVERLGLGSGLPGKPTEEGFFNPATAALLQAGVHPKNTVAYYKKQLEGRGGRLPPGHWEEVTHGLKPSDVIERDELVRRLDSMAPSIEVRRADHHRFAEHEAESSRLHGLMDDILNSLPHDGPRNISTIRQILDEGTGANISDDLRSRYQAYVDAFDRVERHGRPESPPVEPRWGSYVTRPRPGAPVDLADNYVETAIGYREKFPSDWAIERGHNDPRAAARMERAWDEEADLPPGVDPEEAAMAVARGVADRLGGNVGPFRDQSHMGHLSRDGDAGKGPNLEGWTRSQQIETQRRDGTGNERTTIVEEAQDQRRRMVSKQGARKSEADIEDLRAKEEEALQAAMEVGLDARAFVVSPSVVADVKRFRLVQRGQANVLQDLHTLLKSDVDFSKSMNFDRSAVEDILATRNVSPAHAPPIRMLSQMVRDLPHTTSPATVEAIARLLAEYKGANAFNRPDIRRLLEAIDGGTDPAKLDHINTLRALVERNVLQGENLTRAQAIIEANNGRQEALANARNLRKAAEEGVPSSPYTHSKPAAAGLLARHSVLDAARSDVDRIAWPTGNEQAVRFGVGRMASRVAYDRENGTLWYVRRDGQGHTSGGFNRVPEQIPPDKLADYVGADVARELLAGERKPLTHMGPGRSGPRSVVLGDASIVDLPEDRVFGGRGMRSFYGEGPNDGGLFGGQVQSTLRKLDRSREPSIEPLDVKAAGLDPAVDGRYPSVPLSEKAKEKARNIGVSLYSRGGDDRLKTGVNALRDERNRRPTPNEILDLIDAGEDPRAIADDARMSLMEVQRIIREGRRPEAVETPRSEPEIIPPEESGRRRRPDVAARFAPAREELRSRAMALIRDRDGDITRAELAEALGVSPERVSSVVEGDHKWRAVQPRRAREERVNEIRRLMQEHGVRTREELARALGLSVDHLNAFLSNNAPGLVPRKRPPAGTYYGPRDETVVGRVLELIDDGKSYGQVVKILADEGIEVTRGKVAGIVRDKPKGPASLLRATQDERAGLVARFKEAAEAEPERRDELARGLLIDLYNGGDTIKVAAGRAGINLREALSIVADEVAKGGAKPDRSPITRMGLDDDGIAKLLREGKGPSDIAREYGVSPSQVRIRIYSMRDRGLLDGEGAPPAPVSGGYRHGVKQTPELVTRVLALRRAGISAADIGRREGFDRQTAHRIIRGNRGEEEMPPSVREGYASPEDVAARDAMLADMRDGDQPMSYGEIAERFGVTRSQVAAYIRDARKRGVKVNAKPGIGARSIVARRQEEGDEDE
ncbi:MAG: helix-turn-helix domain-containing protein [Desulfurellales bacterium]|nr:MAG: helix-turn-helix domain-containing protein [Desulfurellales bacterium]